MPTYDYVCGAPEKKAETKKPEKASDGAKSAAD